MNYADFIATKTPAVQAVGFEATRINARLFDWQAQLVRWALRLGRAAIFADCGLGKTAMQLEWAHRVRHETTGHVLVLAPLAVAAQTVREAKRFGIASVAYAREQAEVKSSIVVTNYERLDKFDTSSFAGVVLDESSILKSYMGKTKQALIEAFRHTRFRLACTATPSPNDVMELGNHCEFLGVMDSHQMLARWFINDTMAAGKYRLKGHAEADFWRWVCSWSACLAGPQDLLDPDGNPYDGSGFVLPGLEVIEHIVEGPPPPADSGELVHVPVLTATTLHREMRRTAEDRAACAAELVKSEPGEPWVVWCNTEYEAEALRRELPGAVEVTGSDKSEWKENAPLWFKGEYEEPCRCRGKATGTNETAPTSRNTDAGLPTSETRDGESSTPPTQSGVDGQLKTRGLGGKRTRTSTSPSGSKRSSSRPPNTTRSFSDRAEAAPFVDGQTRSIEPSVQRPAGADSTSITATKACESGDSSALPATSDSESSETASTCSSEPSCTCGRLTGQRPKILISKPSILGWGLNFQHCARQAFVGLNYSYESFYQALRRSYRFGQKREVQAHVICARTESGVRSAITRKQEEHRRLQKRMVEVQRQLRQEEALGVKPYSTVGGVLDRARGEGWELLLGDSCEVLPTVAPDSVGFQIWSPPFSSLYTYSASPKDMGNCASDDEFLRQFEFLVPELLRVTVPGRLCVIHTKDLPRYKSSTGASGLRDFTGDVLRAMEAFEAADGSRWVYHSKVTIWKCPVTEMQRTKSHGLLYKTLRADASFSRQGCPDYLTVFRKWVPGTSSAEPVRHTEDELPLETWQRYASPVWDDIDQQDVLNVEVARASQDEKHMCPLQLGLIERCLHLWSNPGDLVLSPFAGIGSEGVVALKMKRRFCGIELKPEYFKWAQRNLASATAQGELQLFAAEGA